jgi:hypothetical protein
MLVTRDNWPANFNDYVETNAVWVVKLSDGTEVFQDDDFHGKESAWIRLSEYCKEKSLDIVSMDVRFRKIVCKLPDNADGYFFCKSVAGTLETKNVHHYLTGTLHGVILKVQKHIVPTMELILTENRDPLEAPQCLIKNTLLPQQETTVPQHNI